ncbi:MAG: hypothetical protein F4Z31_01535 [Gemmatimonadetes bacterium]|nr:hypothetical protein [Gemmatimonadota bacterium]
MSTPEAGSVHADPEAGGMTVDLDSAENSSPALLPDLEWCWLCDEPFHKDVLYQQAWDEELGLVTVEQRCLDRARNIVGLFESR